MPSEIIVTREALDALIRDGDPVEGCYTERPDGRYNLRLSAELRRRLDHIVVRLGLTNHSEAILALPKINAIIAAREEGGE